MNRTIQLSVDDHAQSMTIPVNPRTLVIPMGERHQTIDLLNIGEVLALGNRILTPLTFSSFFPSTKSPFYKYASRAPWDYFNLLDNWRSRKKLVRVIIGGTSINLLTAISKLTPDIREGDADLYYTLELSEYRRLNVLSVQQSQVQRTNGLLERPDTKARPAYHLVRSASETFWYLACKYYEDGTQWKHIASANGCELAYDTHVGQTVILP